MNKGDTQNTANRKKDKEESAKETGNRSARVSSSASRNSKDGKGRRKVKFKRLVRGNNSASGKNSS